MPVFPKAPAGSRVDDELSIQRLTGCVRLDGRTLVAGSATPCGDSLVIVTAEQQWAYAVLFPIRQQGSSSVGRCLIRLTGWVNAGCVGIGLLRANETEIIGEVFRTPHDGILSVDLSPEALDTCSAVVVRNAAVGGRASKITIESISAYLSEAEPAAVPVTAHWVNCDASALRASEESAAALTIVPGARNSRAPKISLILTVKNGMPLLPEAVESLRRQQFRDFEVVVQDCLSNDGSVEYLRGINDLAITIQSEQDEGIGDAWHRAYPRCRGELMGSIDADNLLKPDALDIVVDIFAQCPWAAAVYGSVELIGSNGIPDSAFVPEAFDVVKHLACELVPPWSTAFFSRSVCGDHLFFDRSFRACVDFDVWLRIGSLPILQTERVLGSTRLSSKSMTCRSENYDGFCEAKLRALENYVGRQMDSGVRVGLLRHGAAGIYCWAAESLKRLGAPAADVNKFIDLALRADAASRRALLLRNSLH